jgi:hypothetical protein
MIGNDKNNKGTGEYYRTRQDWGVKEKHDGKRQKT